MMRSAYFAQELLTTFEDGVSAVTLVPSEKGWGDPANSDLSFVLVCNC